MPSYLSALREVIHHHAELGQPVHMLMLDARKAFDFVWTDALFVKLYQCGINAKLWRLLKLWYERLECKVRIGDTISEKFVVRMGVFQGGKWSSRLFQVFYSELIRLLCSSSVGYNVFNIRALSPTYADDIAILAPFKQTLQKLVHLVEEYSSKWRIQFNPLKCEYLEF